MSFNLLQSLDIEYIPGAAAQAIQVFRLEFFIFKQFFDWPQVAAHSPHVGVDFELPVHSEYGVGVGPDANIDEERILGFKFLAKAVEEPVVGI